MDFCRGDEEQACHANDEQKQSLSASHVPLLFFWTRLANTDFLIGVLFVFIVPPRELSRGSGKRRTSLGRGLPNSLRVGPRFVSHHSLRLKQTKGFSK